MIDTHPPPPRFPPNVATRQGGIPKIQPPVPWFPPPLPGGGIDVPAHFAWSLKYETEAAARAFLVAQFNAGYVPQWRPWARAG